MEKSELQDLIRESKERHVCRYIRECCKNNYDQCYNHGHVLCGTFEKFYEEEKYKQRR